jgi:hypothetical protein
MLLSRNFLFKKRGNQYLGRLVLVILIAIFIVSLLLQTGIGTSLGILYKKKPFQF